DRLALQRDAPGPPEIVQGDEAGMDQRFGQAVALEARDQVVAWRRVRMNENGAMVVAWAVRQAEHDLRAVDVDRRLGREQGGHLVEASWRRIGIGPRLGGRGEVHDPRGGL